METKRTILTTTLLLFSLFISVSAFSQNGALRGNVIDDKGEPIMDVNVVIPKLNKGGVTDWEGNYFIPNIPAGTYDIFMNVIGYQADTLKNVVITAGEPTVQNNTMKGEGSDLMDLDIAVVGTKVTGSEEAVVKEVKESDEVVSAVSSEQISKSQDRSAADVMRRIPGATIIDNRFVMVRGLSQRYNTVLLNGIIAPSSEPDSRAFSFDIIPSRLIDRMLIYKSGSPELPGEFAGAGIKIYTKNVVQEDFLDVKLTGGYRAGTTFNEFTQPEGSSTDWLGFDNGKRSLPGGFPVDNIRAFNSPEKIGYAKMLPNTWKWDTQNARPDIRFSVDFGKKWEKGGKKISNLTSIGYSNVNQKIEFDEYRYEEFLEEKDRSIRDYEYNGIQNSNKVRLALIHNWRFQFDSKNIIEFRNLLNQQGVSEYIFKEGEVGLVENPRFERRLYGLRYFNRRIYSGQLQGSHDFDLLKNNTNFTWVLGYTNTKRDEPDYRRARTQRQAGSDEPFQVIIPPSASVFDASRFYSELNENTYAVSGAFITKVPKSDSVNYEFKYGYYGEYKVRDFNARWFSYKRADGNKFIDSLTQLPITELFNGGYFGDSSLALEEGTNFTDQYDANYKLGAAYVGATVPLGEFKLNGGVRTEIFNQQLNSAKTPSQPINVDTTTLSILPYFNGTYNFSEKSLVRFAYSNTVNRPYFREIAPFSYYDFVYNFDIVGNPDLTQANIHNLDARWEIYPNKGEFLAVGAFYKYFINPIETIIGGSQNPVFTFQNAENAYNYGLEVEVRKSLQGITGSKFVNNLSVLFNGALIKSQVNLGAQASQTQRQERPLQGQSPYVVNTGLYYNDDNGLSVSVLYNIFGERIFLVGNIDNRTVYELPRNSLDITITKEFSDQWKASVGISDVFNAPYRLYQDSNEDEKITDVDEPWRTYRRGQYITAGVTFSL